MNENRNDAPATTAAPSEASATAPDPVDSAEATEATGASDAPETRPTEPTVESPPPTTGRYGRRRIAVLTGAVLLTGAVVGAVACTAVAVADADRDPGAPSWARPGPTEDKPAVTAEPGGLAGTLVPYRPDSWSRGPDMGEFGSDVVLNGARTTALLKQSLGGLPRSERKQLEKEIDRRPVKEMAMRSYDYTVGDHTTGVATTVSIVLGRMRNPADARAVTEGRRAFLNALDFLSGGPEIKGHKDAECFRMSSDADDDKSLGAMFCSASEADITVTVTAEGLQPLDAEAVAALCKDQLDRIVEPGESV
ncbi:hypothetical protein [Streptomyces violaceorubidus]